VALRRAVSNLIGNAVTYGGSAVVTLEVRREELKISVEDSGPGIPVDELARVFEPFYRIDASRNRSTGGVGLGLTIARQAIAEHGGVLTLANKPGGGLRAVISLPGGERPVAARGGQEPGVSDITRMERPYAST